MSCCLMALSLSLVGGLGFADRCLMFVLTQDDEDDDDDDDEDDEDEDDEKEYPELFILVSSTGLARLTDWPIRFD
jgi:hypothetical protein